MNKSDFGKVLNYLKTHPTIARLFAEALKPFLDELGKENPGNDTQAVNHIFISASETPSEVHAKATDGIAWMKASQVSQVFGYKAQWVIKRKHLLPPEYVKRSQSGRGKPAWLFHPNSIGLLNQYV